MTITHAGPPDGSGLTPCCGRTPFELAHDDRMTADSDKVTCRWTALPPCTATISNATTSGTVHCVLRYPHRDEYGGAHGGPKHPITGRLRWTDAADGATPHQPTGATTDSKENEA